MSDQQSNNIKKHFEENMLDGDTVQDGQMLSSAAVLEYLEAYYLPREQVEAAIGPDYTKFPQPINDFEASTQASMKLLNQYKTSLRLKLGLHTKEKGQI